MALTGYSSASIYQAAWGSLSADATVCDGNTATGVDAAHSPPNDVTGAIDAGSTQSIAEIDFTVGYGDNAPSIALEWSTDHITWSTVGLPALSPPPHGGAFSLWTASLTSLSITAQYLRLSVSDPSSSAAVRELTIPSATMMVAITGLDLTVRIGTVLGPNDKAVLASGQSVQAALGSMIAAPNVSLTGQNLTASISYVTHPPDVNVQISGLSVAAAAGTASPAISVPVVGQNANVGQAVLLNTNDKTVALTGQNVTVKIECYKNTVADTGPGQKTYTIFDIGGSHDIAPNLYPDYDSIDLVFPLPMGMMASASDHARLASDFAGEGYIYFADGNPTPGSDLAVFALASFGGGGLSGLPYDPTLDFDGLGPGNAAGIVKNYSAPDAVPKGLYTWDGHLIGTYNGPFGYTLGPGYANFSKLVYDNQGGNLTCHQKVTGFYHTTRLYCAFIKIVVDTNSQPVVLFQADTFDGALNVLWVSGGPPGKLKHAVHLSPSLQIGTSTVGWETTQQIETMNSTSSCGIVYLPEGRLYINYLYSGQNRQRQNDQRGTGDVAAWSARGAADQNRISAGGRGQEQAWRFIAGAANNADSIHFSQCRDGQGLSWTDTTTDIKAVDGTARGPLCGGVFTGNQYGLLYTRNSDSKIFYLTTNDPSKWTGTGTDTTFTGNTCGMARHPSGRLVGVRQASAGADAHVLISNDGGQTWITGGDPGITPTPPPIIVEDGGTLYIVYLIDDQPRFAASTDQGTTWQLNNLTTDGSNMITASGDVVQVP